MKAVGMGERTGSKARSREHQRATGGSALIPPPLHQSEYSHPRLGLFMNMPIKELNLSGCWRLQGECVGQVVSA